MAFGCSSPAPPCIRRGQQNACRRPSIYQGARMVSRYPGVPGCDSGSCAATCHWLSIWKQRNRLAPFEIANDGPVALISPPGPIVDPNKLGATNAGLPRLRTTRRRVSLLTGIIRRPANLAAGRPPRASAR